MKKNPYAKYVPMGERHYPKRKTEEEAFSKLMGYPMETIEALAKQLKEINRNRIVELCTKDLLEHGIERD